MLSSRLSMATLAALFVFTLMIPSGVQFVNAQTCPRLPDGTSQIFDRAVHHCIRLPNGLAECKSGAVYDSRERQCVPTGKLVPTVETSCRDHTYTFNERDFVHTHTIFYNVIAKGIATPSGSHPAHTNSLNIVLPSLPDGTYPVRVYEDLNDDGQPEKEEFILATEIDSPCLIIKEPITKPTSNVTSPPQPSK
jgi:hypothetical protein